MKEYIEIFSQRKSLKSFSDMIAASGTGVQIQIKKEPCAEARVFFSGKIENPHVLEFEIHGRDKDFQNGPTKSKRDLEDVQGLRRAYFLDRDICAEART